ncbi:hypothetical protein P22_1106 [Propionispora sp. 2/2-37]|nr:hypothetical protein P22_1106 [Propionispora sp. 2/2-37]
MLIHLPCRGQVIFEHGIGKCSSCGKEIKVKISNK